MQDVVMVCGQQLFDRNPAALHDRIAFFCKEFGGGQRVVKVAFKHDIYQVSSQTMRAHAAKLKAMLGWTADELNKSLHANPTILGRNPSTVARNIQAHNFSFSQALEIYASTPSLTRCDWSSLLQTEKLMYLTPVLQLSPAEIASKPMLLQSSLDKKIGPRGEFMYSSKGFLPDTPLGSSGSSSYIESCSGARFAAVFNVVSASPPLMYGEVFKQHWQQRRNFLIHEMRLSVADILLAELCCSHLCPTL